MVITVYITQYIIQRVFCQPNHWNTQPIMFSYMYSYNLLFKSVAII